MKRSQLVFLSILSGALLFAAWPVMPLTPLIFVAWIPLLRVADAVKKKHTFFGHAFLASLLWNATTTWWMWNSTEIGAIAAIVAESLFMSFPWWGYHIFHKRYGKRVGYVALIVFWMLYEYINLNCQLSWPWLTLGNVFASHPDWVQWYEFTGVSGGTLLILAGNVVLYELYLGFRNKVNRQRKIVLLGIAIAVPLLSIAFTVFHYANRIQKKKGPAGNVVIVQPNIDPYQKFNPASMQQDIHNLVRLSEEHIDSSTQLIIWPETAMSIRDWQNTVASNGYYNSVFAMSSRHTRATLLSGIECMKFYGKEKATVTANKTSQGDYVDDFNSAITIHYGEPLRFYNKSRLVPGVESMPTFLSFMAPVFEQFGGTTGGYGRDETSSVFPISGSSYVAAPIICYESIYGEYVGTYVKKGATLLTIITNDGWWGNTSGHKQHLEYARLRAIETRRWVARSANTGISAVIDDNGQVLETRGWDTKAVIKYNIPALNGETFYVRHGDYLFRFASVLALLLLLVHVITYIRKRATRA